MAWVERRERLSIQGTRQLTYRVRWREPAGRARAKTFPRKVDAHRFAATISADIMRGQYFDPDAGKISFQDYASSWLAAQTFDEGTSEAVELKTPPTRLSRTWSQAPQRSHADPGFTLRTYTHLMPTSTERTRRAIDSVLGQHDSEGPTSKNKDAAMPVHDAENRRAPRRRHPDTGLQPPTEPPQEARGL